ncbi:serpin B9 isoform X3 [Microcebus murinus]|uniref:serpin B9 isoform X3 n=1 Tax=Microcebus murinus TaxID=30608 RepID=UPI003F6ADC04
MDTLAEANGTFAISLLRLLCQDDPSHNVFYSPLSISSALAMVLLGAKGNTAAQMAQEQRPVQMMFQEATFKIAHVREARAQVLELPYAGGELSLLVLLPDDGVELGSVEQNLTFEKFTAWTKPDSMESTEVEVFLPKFKLQEHYNMESVLQRLGVVDVFQQGQADLAMSVERDLCLSKFVHKSFVEVNEEGTEAAAASAELVAECCMESTPRFCADHPFLFFIRHNKANCLLFCGRFSSP